MSMLSNNLGIGLITAPLGESGAGQVLVGNLLQMLVPLAKEIFVITGNYPQSAIFSSKIHIRDVKHSSKKQSMLIKIPQHMMMQIRMSYHLIKVANKIEIVFFFVGAMPFLLPMLTAKLLRKKTIMATTGSSANSIEQQAKGIFFGIGGFVLSHIIAILEKIDFHLADRVIVESEEMIAPLGLNKYRNKISFNSATYINCDLFRIDKDIRDRRNLIGYIGRLDPEKGVLNFAKAIPLILEERDDVEFLIGGDGASLDEVKNELRNNGAYNKVKFAGWIPHDELPNYLNELKLIIAPSYTEGGIPNIIKEAMACGTLVLVSPAAAADITKDGGFILENNSPECIAKRVTQVLEYQEPEKIVNCAKKFAEEKYSYESVTRRYRDILYGRAA